jgi:hypothetical protein
MDKQTKGVLFDPLFNNNPIACRSSASARRSR